MFTGLLPHRHGVHTHDRAFSGLEVEDTFLGSLTRHATVGVSANVFAGPAFDFDDLFEEFTTVSETRRFTPGLDPGAFEGSRGGIAEYLEFLGASMKRPHPTRSLGNGVLAVLDELSTDAPVSKLLDDGASAVARACRRRVGDAGEPFFLFANFMDAHTPLRHHRYLDDGIHDAPPDFSTDSQSVWDLIGSVEDHRTYLRYRRGLYGATIEYLDRVVDSLVDWLADATTLETTVILTADHGENLGYPADDELVRHKSSLSEGLLHVPLLVLDPPAGSDSRVGGYVSHCSLGDLVTSVATDRLPALARDHVAAEVVGMSAGPEPPGDRDYWDRLQRAAYGDETKYVWDSLGNSTEHELDPGSPCWQRAVADGVTVPGWAEGLFATDAREYKERVLEDATRADVDDAVSRRLEQLGYR
jgi:hypothetical protein